LPTASTTHAPPLRGPGPARPLLGPRRSAVLISGLATGPPGRGGRRARTVSGCVNSAFLNISQHFTAHLFRPWIPSSTRWFSDRPEMTLRPHGRPKNQHNGFWHLVCLKTSPVGLTRSRFQIADRLTYSGCEESG